MVWLKIYTHMYKFKKVGMCIDMCKNIEICIN